MLQQPVYFSLSFCGRKDTTFVLSGSAVERHHELMEKQSQVAFSYFNTEDTPAAPIQKIQIEILERFGSHEENGFCGVTKKPSSFGSLSQQGSSTSIGCSPKGPIDSRQDRERCWVVLVQRRAKTTKRFSAVRTQDIHTHAMKQVLQDDEERGWSFWAMNFLLSFLMNHLARLCVRILTIESRPRIFSPPLSTREPLGRPPYDSYLLVIPKSSPMGNQKHIPCANTPGHNTGRTGGKHKIRSARRES